MGQSNSRGPACAGRAGLNRAILDQGWGDFVRRLEEKIEESGGILVRVDPYGTSQQCPELVDTPDSDRDAVSPPGPDALLERRVVDVAGDVELAIELVGLPSRRVKPVFPRAMHAAIRTLRTAPDRKHGGHAP